MTTHNVTKTIKVLVKLGKKSDNKIKVYKAKWGFNSKGEVIARIVDEYPSIRITTNGGD